LAVERIGNHLRRLVDSPCSPSKAEWSKGAFDLQDVGASHGLGCWELFNDSIDVRSNNLSPGAKEQHFGE
jgi:hypothetical protein